MKNLLFSIFLSFLFLTFFSSDLLAQKKNRSIQKADRAFDAELYFEANELYKKGEKKTKNRAIKAEIYFKRGECYRLSGKYKQAVNFYKKAVKSKYNNADAIAILRLADMLMINANYEQALKQYVKYSKKVPTDNKGQIGIKSCEFAMEWVNSPTRYEIDKMAVVNSKNNDYSPAFGNEDYSKIFFVSSRQGSSNNKIDERTGQFFTDIYFSEKNKKGIWSKPVPVQSPINTDGHEGTLSLNRNGTTMFFTNCQAEKKKSLGCEISVSQSKDRKMWGSLNKLQIKLDSNVTVGHPSVSSDEQTVIFSSDMPGGYGGKDLWIVTKWSDKDGDRFGQWSDPVNLGPAVNTDGDELFPFIHEDATLYFASNGHIGMGGLDIYKSELDLNGIYSSTINLKYPINSSADDFGMIVERDFERGYFTSNRKSFESKDGDMKRSNGSDNIYQFELPPLVFSLSGVVTSSKNDAILRGVNVKLVGDNGSVQNYITDNTGSYNFELSPLTTYEIILSKSDFLNENISLTTVGIEESKDFIQNVVLNPIWKEIVLPMVYYDFAKWNLRDTSKIDLDKVLKSMQDHPEIIVELNSHTDSRGDKQFNLDLSQKRANACIDYLVSKGISRDRLIASGRGESSPYVMDKKDGKLQIGDVLTESYINKFKFKKNKEKAHQYNRRTTFKIVSQNYDPSFEVLYENSLNNNQLVVFKETESLDDNSESVMWTIFNDCEYELNIYYNGPIYGGSTSISPNSTELIEIQSGVYRVVASHSTEEKDIHLTLVLLILKNLQVLILDSLSN
ncbi:MAG: hypothetical protein CMP51_06885 [Flavobacteriales bacterium]|nr:hypothetical protein [Flavobacteriales bacterium]